jgi:hypothetical protein
VEPLQWIREFSKQNPQSSTLLFGGVACFAAVAAISGMGIDLESKIRPALYVIGAGVILTITTAIINNKIMVSAISWFIIVMVAIWITLFVVSRFPPSQELACAVYFWQPCHTTADEDAKERASPTAPPVRVQAHLTVPSTVTPGNYKVLVQFAGVLQRGDIKTMMENLQKAGWNVQGVDGGGQRTSAAAGYDETRYRDNADAPAAQALADMVQATKIVSKSVSVKQNRTIENGTLEVWISR